MLSPDPTPIHTTCSLPKTAYSTFKIVPYHHTAAATAETAAAIVATVAIVVAQLHSTAVECSQPYPGKRYQSLL